MTVTLDELIRDLTPEQVTSLRKVGMARIARDGAAQAYAKAIDDAVRDGISFRMLERETGVTAPAIWRSWKRWKAGKDMRPPADITG